MHGASMQDALLHDSLKCEIAFEITTLVDRRRRYLSGLVHVLFESER